ncbi:hypothetical protein FRB99_002712, partial [Tulasnella sp. 403]
MRFQPNILFSAIAVMVTCTLAAPTVPTSSVRYDYRSSGTQTIPSRPVSNPIISGWLETLDMVQRLEDIPEPGLPLLNVDIRPWVDPIRARFSRFWNEFLIISTRLHLDYPETDDGIVAQLRTCLYTLDERGEVRMFTADDKIRLQNYDRALRSVLRADVYEWRRIVEVVRARNIESLPEHDALRVAYTSFVSGLVNAIAGVDIPISVGGDLSRQSPFSDHIDQVLEYLDDEDQ